MDLHTIYCPSCRHPLAGSSGLQAENRCPQCGAAFAIRGDIVDFIPQDDFYWGETDQAKIRRINDQAEASGDWYGSITRNLADRPRLIRYITDSSRMGWLFHVYDERNHAACLDVGSGWGMISFGLSHFYDTVYSLDGVYERLRFQSIRARSDGVDNIRFLRSSLLKLPLGDHSLDLIALNGVLEWVGLSDPNREPHELQRMFLAEIARLLKPEGKVFLGIENRFGLQYLLGHKDHSGLSFTSLAPRPVADWMVARSAGSEQGDFTPLNLLITPQGELTPAHWDFSRARGVPYMHVAGFYHSLFHRTAGAMGAGKYLQGDAPVDYWFAEGLAGRVRIPIDLTSPYYLLRVIRRAREDRGADAIAVGAFTELGSQLRAALDHSLSAESLDS